MTQFFERFVNQVIEGDEVISFPKAGFLDSFVLNIVTKYKIVV